MLKCSCLKTSLLMFFTKPLNDKRFNIQYLLFTANNLRTLVLAKNRVKCHFSPCGCVHFASLVQMFHFSPVGPKKFYCCHFSQLG
ncbi:hypothetical protein Hanom_Chr09g00815591 [Helianthus anomalus]